MIYLNNNTEVQEIFIPRQTVLGGGYVTTTKTYEDGLMEGIEKGKEIQKDQLLNLYVTENGQYEREDGWGVVTVDVPNEGSDCSEAYDKGFEDGYNQGQSECEEVDCSGAYDEGYKEGHYQGKTEGYENGYNDGYNQGQNDCPSEGGCNLEDKWVNPSMGDVDGNGLIVITPSEGYDGLSRTVIDPQTIYNEGVEEGKNQGGDCPELTTIDITENGSYEGAFSLVNVNVPQKGDSCNLEDKWVNPSMGDVDGNGLIVITPSEGYDGLSRTVIDPQTIYNEGVESGSCNLEDKIILPSTSDIVDNWLNVYPSDGYDGMFAVSVNMNNLKNEWMNGEGDQIQETKWATPSTNDVDDNGFIVIKPDDGYDAMGRVAMDVSTIKSEWTTIGKNSITDYYWCPLTVSDSGIGERAKSFSLADEQTVYDENDVLIDRNDMFYLPTANNLNEFRLTKKAVRIVFPFKNEDAQYISSLYLNDDIKVFSCMDKNLSVLSTIEVGTNIRSFVLSNCNLLRLNKIVVHSNYNCDVLLSHNVKSTGTLYINENNDFKNNWINALPSGWTVEYL